MSFPTQRPRRLRRSESLRGLVLETRLTTAGFIYPMFVCPGTKVRKEVGSMPGVHQQSVDQIVEECKEVEALGIPGVILFRITGVERCARKQFDIGAGRGSAGD